MKKKLCAAGGVPGLATSIENREMEASARSRAIWTGTLSVLILARKARLASTAGRNAGSKRGRVLGTGRGNESFRFIWSRINHHPSFSDAGRRRPLAWRRAWDDRDRAWNARSLH